MCVVGPECGGEPLTNSFIRDTPSFCHGWAVWCKMCVLRIRPFIISIFRNTFFLVRYFLREKRLCMLAQFVNAWAEITSSILRLFTTTTFLPFLNFYVHNSPISNRISKKVIKQGFYYNKRKGLLKQIQRHPIAYTTSQVNMFALAT